MKYPEYKSSPTLEKLLKQFEADNSFRPDPASIEQMEAELKVSREEFDKRMKDFERQESPILREPPVAHFVIEMGPDWYTSRVTPEKIKWHLDKGMSLEQIAVKLKRSVKTIEKTFAKIGQIPVEKPIKVVPYGWKLTKDKYLPDETEQWVIKKVEDDQTSGKKLDDIASELMKVGIKPRGGGLWFMRRLAKVLKENNKMWNDYRASKLLLFERGRMSPG